MRKVLVQFSVVSLQLLPFVSAHAQPTNAWVSGIAREAGASFSRLVLVNAETGEDLTEITEGMTVNLASLPTKKINIRADTSGTFSEVVFQYDTYKRFRVERVAPYTIAGKKEGRYNGWTPRVGAHSITVQGKSASKEDAVYTLNFTVIDDANGGDTPLGSLTSPAIVEAAPTVVGSIAGAQERARHEKRYTSHDPYGPLAVTELVLLDGTTGVELMPLKNGMTLNLSTLPQRLNLAPSTAGDIAAVEYQFDKSAKFSVAEERPFTLLGRGGQRAQQWKLREGIHTLIATPFSRLHRSGIPLQVSFRVLNEPVRERDAAFPAREPARPAEQVREEKRVPYVPKTLPSKTSRPRTGAPLLAFEQRAKAEERLLRHMRTAKRLEKVRRRAAGE